MVAPNARKRKERDGPFIVTGVKEDGKKHLYTLERKVSEQLPNSSETKKGSKDQKSPGPATSVEGPKPGNVASEKSGKATRNLTTNPVKDVSELKDFVELIEVPEANILPKPR